MAEAKFGLLLSSSGVFKDYEMRQQKKKWRKLESPAGNCMHTKPKVGVKLRLISHFRELCNYGEDQFPDMGSFSLNKNLVIVTHYWQINCMLFGLTD